MKRWMMTLTASALALAICGTTVSAQFVVYDPTNFAEAVRQYAQALQQYLFLVKQATRVPVDIGSRYHGYSVEWSQYDLAGLQYAGPLLDALNAGDVTGTGYRSVTTPLDVPTDVLARMSMPMRQRLGNQYSTIELSDSMNRLAVDQTGQARADGPLTLQAIRNVEHDIDNPDDDFHSQTALLEKINAAEALALRVGEQANQFELSTLEQQIMESKRERDTEAAVMNATIYQWRYGQAYGDDLFHNTASNLDAWRPY
jgi:hypothetical protein